MILSRRDALKVGAGLGAMAVIDPQGLLAQQAPLITKAIPSSGEQIPVIGLGSASTFNLDPSEPEAAAALEVIRLFRERGGTAIDTAPSYGQSEAFVGYGVREIRGAEDLFLATKVNVQDGGVDAALAQMDESSRTLGKYVMDLMQVWNLGDNFRSLSDRYLVTHLEAVREWKDRGRTRYIGITTSFPQQYDLVENALRSNELDFVQLDYSIGDRVPEERLLPLAMDRGVAVMVNQPFTSGRLFGQVSGRSLPGFAAEIGCQTWAQYFLKYIVSHPAVTCAIPATSDPEHLVDNMGACRGVLPDEETRARMVEAFEG